MLPGAWRRPRSQSVEGITEYRLDNGLKVLLFPDSSKPTVTVNVTYLVGSRHEGYGESGMAHLLEHMLFKGTAKRDGIMGELTNHGAQFNGTTSYDRTNYFETLTATDENLRWALEMEADRMVNSRVSRKDLDTEMTVVRNEFERGENSPGRVLEERVVATAYLWHSYGRSTIGARSDIEVPIERLQAFYRNYYQPDNAVLVVAGKLDEAKTLGWIKETFGAIPKPARTLTPTYTEEPVQDGEREVTLQRVGDNQLLMMAYHVPAGADPDSAAMDVLSAILDEAPAGRLYKALVETKKAISVRGENNQLHDAGYLLFAAEVRKEGSLDDVRQTMQGVLDGIVKEPPNKEEIDRVLTRRKKDFELLFNNPQRVALLMSEWASMGDWRLMFLDRDRTEKVTPEDIARVANRYLKASNLTVGRFVPVETAPQRAEVHPTPDVAAMLNNYAGRAAVEQGEAFDPTPANIESRIQRVTLPNGLKLVMLPKKTRGGTVTASLALHYGDEKSVFDKGTAAQFAGAMLMRGTQKHTRQQLQDELDQLKAQMNAGAGDNDATLSVATIRASIVPALRLAAEVLRQPAFPETEFEQLRQASLGRVEGSLKEPGALAPLALRRHLIRYPAGDPRAVTTFEEDIANTKKLTLADVKKFYGDFFGASNAELAIVGDFDPAEVRKVVEQELGTWKSPAPYQLVLRKRDAVMPGESDDRDARQGQRRVHGGFHPGDESGRSGLSGADVREPHAGRRFEEPFVAAHPRKGRLQLWRGQRAGGIGAVAIRAVHGAGDGGSAEHSESGRRVQGRARQDSEGWLHGRRSGRREEDLSGRADAGADPGRGARAHAGAERAVRLDHGAGGGSGEQGRGADHGADQRRCAEVSGSGGDFLLQGGGFQEGGRDAVRERPRAVAGLDWFV